MTYFTARRGGDGFVRRVGAAAAAAAAILGLSAGDAFAHPDTVIAPVLAPPGYPDGLAVHKNRLYVAGPSQADLAGPVPSEINVFHKKTGALLESVSIQGEDLLAPHALTGLAIDSKKRIHVLSSQLGLLRLERVQKHTWVQSVYAGPFPDLPVCAVANPDELCSPTDLDLPPLPSDIAFDEAGNAFVTDAAQAAIYRIPKGGGAVEVWLTSPLLAGFFDLEGASGIATSPDGALVYVTVAFSADAPWEGRVYAIPNVDDPTDADLALAAGFSNFEAPSGLAFGQHGALYVALSVMNEIAVVTPFVGEVGRFAAPSDAAIPMDGPSHLAFDGRGRIFVTNAASYSFDDAHFAVLGIDVGDKGHPVRRPHLP